MGTYDERHQILMKGFLALFILSLWFLWSFRVDRKARASLSAHLWIVVIWIIIHSTRTASAWLGLDSSHSRDEGSPFDAAVELALMIAAATLLFQRSVNWSKALSANIWLFVFYLFWFASIAWSDYPFITFKRVFKDTGNIIMVLVVLTEIDPWEAIKAVLLRIAYLCIPLSIVLIRYYPEWGRAYVGYHRDHMMNVGVATHKNMLGVIVLVSTIALLWDLLDRSGKSRNTTEKLVYASRVVVFSMCWYLFLIIDSATSLVTTLVGSVLVLSLGHPFIKRKPGRMELLAVSVVSVAVLLDAIFNIKEALVVDALGRNMTLTSRTDMWQIVDDYVENPLVGAGFNTFWTGDRLSLLPEHLQGNVQAHNGYVETYLNGGLIGVSLLLVLLLSAYLGIRKRLPLGLLQDRARLVIILTVLVHNYTEASFTKIGILWFLTIYAIFEYRPTVTARKCDILIRSRCDTALSNQRQISFQT